MSAEDPTLELDELYKAIESGQVVSDDVVKFFDTFDEVARSILQTIDSMRESGAQAPTPDQARALENIYEGAIRHLEQRMPIPRSP